MASPSPVEPSFCFLTRIVQDMGRIQGAACAAIPEGHAMTGYFNPDMPTVYVVYKRIFEQVRYQGYCQRFIHLRPEYSLFIQRQLNFPIAVYFFIIFYISLEHAVELYRSGIGELSVIYFGQ